LEAVGLGFGECLLVSEDDAGGVVLNPSQGDDGSYPADLQAAQEKVAAKHQAERNAMMNAGQNGQAKPAP